MSALEQIDWHDEAALARYYQTHPLPQRLNAGIIVASCCVSVLGSYCTLLLLSRRTSNNGWRNMGWLGTAALTMSSVAIWGMHFVGSRVRLAASPEVSWYIRYNPGFTVMSLFVPMVTVAVAFVFLGSQSQFVIWRVLSVGIVCGGVISLMHFSASFSLPSFRVTYSTIHVVFSIVLACTAAAIAMTVFFRFRAHWEENFVSRLLCAVLLAGAVTSMHYLAQAGTSYYVRDGISSGIGLGDQASNRILIAIGVMCGALCFLALSLSVYDSARTHESRKKARQVVLASACFDKTGALLVMQDGTLPMQTIDVSLEVTEILDELSPRKATFQWIHGVSREWALVGPFLDRILVAMRKRPQLSEGDKKTSARADRAVRQQERSMLKIRILESAVLLATELNIPLSQLGVVYSSLLTTGQQPTPLPANDPPVRGDEESSMRHIQLGPRSEGVMIFVVSQSQELHSSTIGKRSNRGYRFSEPKVFANVFADRVGVSSIEIQRLLEGMSVFSRRGIRPVVQPSGCYVGLFGVRASGSRHGGLECLTYAFAKHQIPAYRIPETDHFPLEYRAWIARIAGASMRDVMVECARHSGHETSGPAQNFAEFRSCLLVALDALEASLHSRFPRVSNTSRLSCELLEIPSSLDGSTVPAHMIIFSTVLDEANSEAAMPANSFSTLVFTPYASFSTAQTMLMGGRDKDEFVRAVHMELESIYPPSLSKEYEAATSLDEKNTLTSLITRRSTKSSRGSVDNLSPEILLQSLPCVTEQDWVPSRSGSASGATGRFGASAMLPPSSLDRPRPSAFNWTARALGEMEKGSGLLRVEY